MYNWPELPTLSKAEARLEHAFILGFLCTVRAIIAGIILARHLDTADDLSGEPQGTPRTDKMIGAAIQWTDKVMRKIDSAFRPESVPM